MAKRKRPEASNGVAATSSSASKKAKSIKATGTVSTAVAGPPPARTSPCTIQVVAGSYDRVLHGMMVTVGSDSTASFADSFLFAAHTSAIRCLALSPPSAPTPNGGRGQKVLLASGSTDERINVYNLSAHPPSARARERQRRMGLAGAGARPILEDARNRELGTLLHHSATVTALGFPTRSKLLSAGEDSTVAVTRTRDWSLLSTIRAPVPKQAGRPSGDTAAQGMAPSGVNDFAVDPSLRVMITVGKGERCMRLWNLVTGKKAGVLNFGRETLAEVGGGVGGRQHAVAAGEARRVLWGSTADGEEFCVGFDRDAVVYDMGAVPKCRVMGDIRTKVHQLRYVTAGREADRVLLAVSTEDGRILFFSTAAKDLEKPVEGSAENGAASAAATATKKLPVAKLVGQLGGKDEGVSGRIKDFAIVEDDGGAGPRQTFAIGGSSDGKVRIWKLDLEGLGGGGAAASSEGSPDRAGTLLGTYETQNRITCLVAFATIPRPEGLEESEDEDEDDEDDAEDGEEGGSGSEESE